MPLVVNIGLSRKASENYQSAGVSLNLSAELDQALLTNPNELHAQIGRLYTLANEAVIRQLDQQAQPDSPAPAARPNGGNGHSQPSNGGNGLGGSTRSGYPANGQNRTPAPARSDAVPPATASQLRAIRTIARKLNLDPEQQALNAIGVGLNDLTIAEASQLIDDLKAMQGPSQPARR